jgi:hypothetical protein
MTGCDRQETVFCAYSLIYAATCPAGGDKCSPTHILCRVPVKYKGTQSGTISVKLDFMTGKSTSMTLTAGEGFRAEVPTSAGGSITPLLWETPVGVTDFEKQKVVKAGKMHAFDWSRKMEFSVGPAVSGGTYVALVATDHKNNQAQTVKSVPAHTEKSDLPTWQGACADEGKKEKLTGSLNFEASGLVQADVEAATKTALAFTFDVNPKLIEITATKARRLEADTRHLAANTWTVTYAVQVTESKSAMLKKTIANIQKNPTDFAGRLEAALNDLPSTTGARKTISKFAIAPKAPTKVTAPTGGNAGGNAGGNSSGNAGGNAGGSAGAGAGAGAGAPGDEAVVAGCRTSQWLSGVVAVLVALIGSM